MRRLIDFINEEYEQYRVKNLEVPYICNKDENKISFKVPSSYSEDDFQIYIQDMYLNELPASENNVEEFFGKNSSNIYDVIFEYDKYEKIDDEVNTVIDFDSNIDSQNDVEEFSTISITGLRYIIKFDKFDLNVENESDIPNIINDIFKRCESNDTNEYPIEITLDEKNIKYK